MMVQEIALLLVAAVVAAASSVHDELVMHTMDGPNTAPPLPLPTPINSIASEVGSCANFKCAAGDVCMMQAVNCIVAPCHPVPTCVPKVRDGPSCKTIKCSANTTCVDLPTGSVCQPKGDSNSTVNPCAAMMCAKGTICKLQTVNCLVPPCPPLPQCVAQSTGPSCMTMKCSANTTCVDLPTGSVCKPNGDTKEDPCALVDCAKGTICKLQTVNCLVPPCPPLPQCVAQSTGPSCMTMKCSANTTCVDLPTGSVCKPNGDSSSTDECALVDCAKGTICKMVTVNCLVAPCPRLAQCVSTSTGPSCMTMKCSANTTCVDLPTGSVCKPNGGSKDDPCAVLECAIGSICQLKTVTCKKDPCPPVAECVPRTPNTSACRIKIKCKEGFECRNGDKGESCYPISTPKPDACANHKCPTGQTCSAIQVNCLVAPCPPPKPVCIESNEGENPCNAMECAKGFFCVVQEDKPSCVPQSGASCAATSCPVNTECVEFKNGASCLKPKPTLTCATVKCAANTTCTITPKGPTCTPIKGEDPCNAMECAEGFFCIDKNGEGECVAHSGASCAATSCPVNTECVEFKNGASCRALPSGGCAIVRCGGGTHCKETADGPKCIRGGRDDRVVDEFGCGRGEQYTECKPQCEDTCRGIQTCDLSIHPTSNSSMPESNNTIWTNSTIIGNSTNLPSHCVSGCICRDHFKRNIQGNCVPNKRCWLTPGCRDSESWSTCRGCEHTCENPNGRQICPAMCESGCSCDEGYVRSKRGMCVLPEDCSAIDLINGDHGNQTIAIEG